MNTATMTPKNEVDMSRTVAVLPPEEQERLVAVRESKDLPALRLHVYALRAKKWPLRAIGDPLDTPRSTVRMWEKAAGEPAEDELPSVPECPRAERERGERTVRLRPDVPPDERAELKELAIAARQVRGRTPKEAPARIAADKLDELIEGYIARKIAVKRIADHMGVTARAVAARHERYLARKAAEANGRV